MSTPMTWLVIFPNLQVPDLMIQIPSLVLVLGKTDPETRPKQIFFFFFCNQNNPMLQRLFVPVFPENWGKLNCHRIQQN